MNAPLPTPRYRHVSFLSDYGVGDEFVGVVKGVIADIAPHVSVLDLTHEIPAFDVRAGSLALARSITYVPEGVVLAVVDPGVGTSRRAIAVSVAGGRGVLIGPDNGVLSMAVALAGGADEAIELTNDEYHLVAPGATFAGRDIFAPVAAHVCNGVPLHELGPAVDPALLMPGVIPLSRREGDVLVAEVTWVDRYGNCQLNVSPDDVAEWGDVLSLSCTTATGESVTRSVQRATSFEGIGGGLGLVLDSYGMLAVCMRQRSAADELRLAAGDSVQLRAAAVGETPGVTVAVQLGSRVSDERR
jgi:hypothetical protein